MMKKLRRIVSKLGIPWQDPLERLRILWVGIDISKRQHTACLGTQDQVLCRRLRFTNSRRGLERLEAAIRRVQSQSQATAVVIGMEPSGVYWKPLFAQLRLRGYQVVSVDAKAVKHNRKTLSGNGSKTDRKDAYCIYDLLRQGKFFLPVDSAAGARGVSGALAGSPWSLGTTFLRPAVRAGDAEHRDRRS